MGKHIMEPQLKTDMNTILDCFSGADGGVSFVRFKHILECVGKNEDLNSEILNNKIRTVVRDFAKLIEYCSLK